MTPAEAADDTIGGTAAAAPVAAAAASCRHRCFSWCGGDGAVAAARGSGGGGGRGTVGAPRRRGWRRRGCGRRRGGLTNPFYASSVGFVFVTNGHLGRGLFFGERIAGSAVPLPDRTLGTSVL